MHSCCVTARGLLCCACRERRTAAGKLWGASMLGVCGASITFHVSSGKWRDLGRKLDYW
jgi:predicted membrane channel-forming protein YqfA (hemolysin III family)